MWALRYHSTEQLLSKTQLNFRSSQHSHHHTLEKKVDQHFYNVLLTHGCTNHVFMFQNKLSQHITYLFGLLSWRSSLLRRITAVTPESRQSLVLSVQEHWSQKNWEKKHHGKIHTWSVHHTWHPLLWCPSQTLPGAFKRVKQKAKLLMELSHH